MAKSGKTPAAVLHGGARPKKKAKERRSWTKARKAAFLAALAETCNVTAAARIAGVGCAYAYTVRQKDAAFRAAWDQAITHAYSRLGMELLKRALHGVEEVRVLASGETRTMRKYSDSVALTLLRMHRDTAVLASEPVDDQEVEEARERIVERLARIRERIEAEQGGTIETKGQVDRIELIRWAIGRRNPSTIRSSAYGSPPHRYAAGRNA